MLFIILSFILCISILTVLRAIGLDSNLLILISIFIESIVISGYAFKKYPQYNSYILLGIIFRLIILFIDNSKIFTVIHSGGDSEHFYEIALDMFNRNSYDVFHLTKYEYVIAFFFNAVGPYRIIVQYSNEILGILTIIVGINILNLLNIESKVSRRCIIIFCLFPHSIIFSSILLREMWCTFFLILSIYYSIKYYVKPGKSDRLLSILSISIAAIMHSAILIGIIPIVFYLFMYDRSKNKIQFNIGSFVIVLFVFAFIVYLIFSQGMFSDKIVTSSEDLSDRLSYRSEDAGSAYLAWLSIESPIQMIVFSPLKIFYFLFSPIIIDWRGVNDIIAFFLDSIFYIFFIYKLFKHRKCVQKSKKCIYNMLISIIVFLSFIFAYGTITSGTAMRHRHKIFPIILIAYALTETNFITIKNEKYFNSRKK